jgi:hypothetical protein
MKTRACIECGLDFVLKPNKPGLVGTCPDCSTETVEQIGGNMIWEHKTAPMLEIKPVGEAEAFARKQKRFGAGPLRSIVTSKSTGDPGEKSGSGAEAGAQYISGLGEKRSVKR